MKADAGKPYRPSNGSEGDGFYDNWCRQCQRDKAMREGAPIEECDDNELCKIITLTVAHDLHEAEYPKEWIYDADGQPCCTAFVPVDSPIPRPKCEHTQELPL